MPPQAKHSSQSNPHKTLIIDNGAYTIKAGFATENPSIKDDCHIIPNCVAKGREGARDNKIFIGGQLDDCKDFAEMMFRRPVEKGFLVNWDGEMDIWKQSFLNEESKLQCDPSETTLILTEAPHCPQALQANTDQIVFEEFEFSSAYRCLGPTLNSYNDLPSLTGDLPPHPIPAECLLLIDSGYSHTTITPILHGRPIHSAIRRLELGGKHLTNYLKEMISLRHFGLMEDSYLVSHIKEDACFVSQDLKRDLDETWIRTKRKPHSLSDTSNDNTKSIVQDYVLPDYVTTFRGHLRPHDASRATIAKRIGAGAQTNEEFFPLGNERFLTPELLFNPSDIGLAQAGISEVVVQSLSAIPAGLWPGMLANVIMVGGNARFTGLVERLEAELRALTPGDCVVKVKSPKDPLTYTWLGGARLAGHENILKSVLVSRDEYLEHGEAWTARRFATGPR